MTGRAGRPCSTFPLFLFKNAMLRLFSTAQRLMVERDGKYFALPPGITLDSIFQAADPEAEIAAALKSATPGNVPTHPLAPLQSQEVWAAGVTYFRSRTARMEESKDAGGGSFYDRVYEAPRPELFFKS